MQKYYYDFKTEKLYVFYPESYVRRGGFIVWILFSFAGVLATLDRIILGKIPFPLTTINMLLCVVIAIIECCLVSKIYDDGEKKKHAYIRTHVAGKDTTMSEVVRLYNEGKAKRRRVYWVIIPVFLLIVLGAFPIYLMEQTICEAITVFAGIVGETIFIKILVPVKNHRLKKKFKTLNNEEERKIWDYYQ